MTDGVGAPTHVLLRIIWLTESIPLMHHSTSYYSPVLCTLGPSAILLLAFSSARAFSPSRLGVHAFMRPSRLLSSTDVPRGATAPVADARSGSLRIVLPAASPRATACQSVGLRGVHLNVQLPMNAARVEQEPVTAGNAHSQCMSHRNSGKMPT